MFNRYVKTSLAIILIIAAMIRIFPVKSYSPLHINRGRYEEILVTSGIIADFDMQKTKKSVDYKILPNSLYNIIVKQYMLYILLNDSLFTDDFKPDLRSMILNLIPVYFNGSKYKDVPLL